MIRITKISVKNFKSLYDFEIVFPENTLLTVLIGLNGAGKSTILQFLDFIGELFHGKIPDWLHQRTWKTTDLTTVLHSSIRKHLVDITVEGKLKSSIFEWQCSYNPNLSMLRCTAEKLSIDKRPVVAVKDGKLFLNHVHEQDIFLNYSGSIFSALQDRKFQEIDDRISFIVNFLSSIRSFDMLSPRHIKNRSRNSKSIGMSGEKLAGFISALSSAQKNEIERILCKFYPFIHSYDIKTHRGGWNEIMIWEHIGIYDTQDGRHRFRRRRQAQHANDGTLRLLAIVAALYSQDNFLLFDEIENGFNPSIIKEIVSLLLNTDKQILVTTHSPEILQYIPDDLAQQAVKFIYKDQNGATLAADFFSDEEADKKLRALSPGEVFLDVDLNALAERMNKRAAQRRGQ